MGRTKQVAGRSSTYGQACLQCYKAKCRCVPNASGDSCERCHRLKKSCQLSDSIRNRVARRTEESDSRIAQLEEKIETLMSAMQCIVTSSGSSINLEQLLNVENNPVIVPSLADNQGNSSRTDSSIGDQPTPTSDTSPAALHDTIPVYSILPDASHLQAKNSLDFFRSRMLPCFPFINFPPDITAEQLYQTRPFLFRAIFSVTTFSTNKKLALADELKHILFKSALIDVQSSIDLLLGLLTYLAWSTDAFLGRADLVSRLMMLAISLVYDLRLFRPRQLDVQLFMSLTQGKPYEAERNATAETVQEFMEKQRALLACFVLSSNVSSHLGRQDALRWTPQMEEACRVIEKDNASPADQVFVSQVRLHALKQRAAHIREQHERDRASAAASSAHSSIPSLLYLKTMKAQLHELTSSFPTDVHQKDALNVYASYINLYINQLAYSISFESPLLDISDLRTSSGLLPGFERLECLWQSVECIKSWLDNFYKIDSADLVGFPFHFWSQMIQCITILKYLSALSDPAWDCQAVRNTVDLIPTMERMVQKLDVASKEPGLQCDDSIFQLLSRLLCKCRAWADAWFSLPPSASIPANGLSQSADTISPSQSHSIPDLDQMVWVHSMDLEDGQWLERMLGGPAAFS